MISAELGLRLDVAPDIVLEKRFHASSPAYENTKYGTPPLGRSATRPKTKLNSPAVTSGPAKIQSVPSTVWRYRTVMSRRPSSTTRCG